MSNNYSYSKIDTYCQCPYKFKLKYVDNHYTFCESIATALGTAIHACEESIAKALQNHEQIDYTTLKNNLILEMYKLKNKFPDDFYKPDKSGRTYEEKIYYYLENTIYNLEKYMQAHPTYEIVGIEQEFNFTFRNYTFKGFIDRAFKDAETNKLLIQDIKTYALEVESSKLKVPLQFVVYCLASQGLYGLDLSDMRCEYYLPFCNLAQSAGEDSFVKKGIKELEQIFTKIEAQDFKPKPSPLCHYCEFCITNPNAPEDCKLLCPYHSEWTPEFKTYKIANKWENLENDALISLIYKKEMSN